MNHHSHHHGLTAGAQVPAGIIYTCPMHPEVRQDQPGHCPKCQMNLVPEDEVIALAAACVAAGADESGLSDTTGMANPAQVNALLKQRLG